MSRKGEDYPQFPEFPIRISAKMQLIYVQRYASVDIVEPTEFQVFSDQLRIDSFGREKVRCFSLIVMALEHYMYDGQCISFPLMYYVDSLLTRT